MVYTFIFPIYLYSNAMRLAKTYLIFTTVAKTDANCDDVTRGLVNFCPSLEQHRDNPT